MRVGLAESHGRVGALRARRPSARSNTEPSARYYDRARRATEKKCQRINTNSTRKRSSPRWRDAAGSWTPTAGLSRKVGAFISARATGSRASCYPSSASVHWETNRREVPKRIHPPKFHAYLRRYLRTRRARLRAQGRCVDCGKRRDVSKVLCAICLHDRRLRWNTRHTL